MTTKIDGNNGVLQSYDYQVLTTGFSYTFASGITTLIAQPAGTLATGTITMPGSPADGMVVTIESTQQVTAVSVLANAGQTMTGAPSQLIPNQPLSFIYRQSNTTWYAMAGGAGRATALVSGTSVASTSGTSIDFTGIPAWVKRITVMFNGVSTNGTNGMQVQLGAGSVETSGYVTTLSLIQSATPAANSSIVAGFPVTFTGYVTAGSTLQGAITINLLGSNTWCATSLMSRETAGNTLFQSAGAKTLSGTLDRVRVTTFAGTDTFDAGSINILYE